MTIPIPMSYRVQGLLSHATIGLISLITGLLVGAGCHGCGSVSGPALNIDGIPVRISMPTTSGPTSSTASPIMVGIRHDTITRTQWRDRLRVERVRATRIDTLIMTQEDSVAKLPMPPFVAQLDTIFPSRDTLHTEFEFPENRFSVLYKSRPDSVRTIVQTITVTVVKDIPWWERPLYILGGTAVGFGTGFLYGNVRK